MARLQTIAYIDGYNLYHGIIDKRNIPSKGITPFSKNRPWGDLLWLNLESLIYSYKFNDIDLKKIKFFEAPSYDPQSLVRQQVYKNALLSLDSIDNDSFFGGEFKENQIFCPNCRTYYTHRTEKKTDVLISTEILNDYFNKKCECLILLTGDSDLTPTIEKVKMHEPNFPIFAIFPPFRASGDIKKIVGKDGFRRINYQKLVINQFPEQMEVNGFLVEKPMEYRRSN